jgi:hypothetical protein
VATAETDLAARAAADLDRLVRRLRALSARAWRDPARRAAVDELVRDLAALTAPERPPPAVPTHALGDAVAVLGADALDAGATAEVADLVGAALRATR